MIKLNTKMMRSQSLQSQMQRRTVLRGLLGGAGVTFALPYLESLSWRRGSFAQTLSTSPKRFIMYFWGNGSQPDRWLPTSEGPDWGSSILLEPLSVHRQDVSILSGMEVKVGNIEAHISGPAGFFTGKQAIVKPSGGWTFQAPTIDQQLASLIGGETLYRSLEVGVEPGMRGMSLNGPDSINTPESDPLAFYERLFGPTFREPGQVMADPKLGLRRSVLDAVLNDLNHLKTKVGRVDRMRLEQHSASVRDLELRLARLQEDPVQREACIRPQAPSPIDLLNGRVQMLPRARLMADLSVMALACDLTRVLSFWYCDPLSNLLHINAQSGHHQLTHDEPGDQPQVTEIILGAHQSLAYFIEVLKTVSEGEGSLLDHCALLATSDVSEGKTHQIDEYPIILAGRAGGALKVGEHYRSKTKESTSHLALSIARALDVPIASYGEEEAFVDEGLSVIEA